MARIVGDSKVYRFALLNAEGEPTETAVEFPSVTEITSLLSKEALIGWAFKVAVEGAKDLAARGFRLGEFDYDTLKNLLKDHGHTPWVKRDSASGRGQHAHDVLELLATGKLDEAYALVAMLPDEERGYANGVLEYWLENEGGVEAVEQVVYSLKHCFAGTLDLVRIVEAVSVAPDANQGPSGLRTLTDLKTSKDVYEGHILQVSGYKVAWEEMHPDKPIDRLTILLAKEDGKYREVEVEPQEGAFLALREVYRLLKEGNGRGNSRA